jgi:hypothetical protein
VEFNPEDMLLGVDETEDDGDLEAELLALTGETASRSRKPAPKGQGEFSFTAGLVQVHEGQGSHLTAWRSQPIPLVL